MNILQSFNLLYNRSKFEDLIPVRSCAYNLFVIEGDTPYIGACFICEGLTGCGDETVEMLKSILCAECPDDSFLQFSLIASTNRDQVLNVYKRARDRVFNSATGNTHATDDQKATFKAMYQQRMDYLLESSTKTRNGIMSKSMSLVISMKCPLSGNPTEREYDRMKSAALKLEKSLETARLCPYQINGGEYIMLLRSILFMGDRPRNWDNKDLTINQQILAHDEYFECHPKYTVIGNSSERRFVKSLSAERFPEGHTSLSTMNMLIGDPFGGSNQIPDPFMLTLTVHLPSRMKKEQEISKKRQTINYQLKAFGSYVARIRSKDEGLSLLEQSTESQNKLCHSWFNLQIFSNSPENCGRTAASVRTYFQVYGFEMCEDNFIHGPALLQQLPMLPEKSTVKRSSRYHTMTTEHAAHICPVITDWKGSGVNGAMVFESRRGQTMVYDLYDSQTNFNGVIAATSGAGKSFLANDIILSYLQKGAWVRVIDNGESYSKLCELLGGEWIKFGGAEQIILNPFTHVISINEEMEMLKLIIEKMAAPQAGFDDWESSVITEAILLCWHEYGSAMTITELAERLESLSNESQTRRDKEGYANLAKQLFPYTRHGTYGLYFDGKNSLNYNNVFVVLELKDLAQMKNLQAIVLLQLIIQLQRECFNNTDVEKVILLDEAWEILDDPIVAKFIAESYRKFRKFRSSCLIITQSLHDLYNTESGEAIRSNTANVFVLKQDAEAVDSLKKSGRFEIGEFGFKMLRSLETVKEGRDRYSEVLIRADGTFCVVRFSVDRFTQLLYSTDAKEVSRIKGLQKEYQLDSTADAILKYMELESGNRGSLAKSS